MLFQYAECVARMLTENDTYLLTLMLSNQPLVIHTKLKVLGV